MFTRRLSWLTTSLLYLLFASPALSGHSPPTTTPYDPFHAIAALAPKPHEEPVCCLKPLTPLEPVDDDLFLSFEDWKARRFSEAGHHGHKNNVPSNAGAESPAEAVTVAHSTTTTVDTITNLSSSSADDAVEAAHAPELTDSASTPAQSAGEGTTSVALPPPLPPSPPHFRVPLTDRFNYASVDCSARVHTAQPAAAAKSAANILSSQRDRYMLSPCGATPRFVVVELCEDIRIDTVQLANFEFFSGVFREFMVSVAKTYIAADAEGWTVVGTYVGKNVRGVQSFHPPTSIRDFYRYIRIDFHSHYSNEYYCPISLLRVYGLTHLEQWKWDTWEEESRARQDQNAQTATALVDAPSEPEQHAPETPEPAQRELSTPQEKSIPATPSSDSTLDFQDPGSESSHPLESEEGHFRHSTDIARLEPSTSPQAPSTDTGSSIIPPSSSASPQSPVFVQSTNDSTQKSRMFISNDSTNTTMASSSVFISSRTANVSGTTGSTPHSSSQPTVTPTSAPHVSQSSASPPPQVNFPPPPPSPSNVHAGESIYRTIMNRLSALEANTTLYARYVEEQTSAMREMLRRLSEDIGRLEGIGRAQAQMYARSVSDFEKHRREMELEQRTLISQVNYLAEEIVLEKRLGIAQLCLLLAVLVFLSVTRGSPGEFHIPRSNSRGADVPMRGWGRRSLRLSGDWFPSRLRSSSSGPPSASQGSHTPTSSMSLVPRASLRQAPPPPPPSTAPATTSLPSPSTTPGPGLGSGYHSNKMVPVTATTTTPTFLQKRAPLYLTPTQHHYRVPHSRSTHTVTRTRIGGGGGGTSSPTLKPIAIPIQRSSSHGASFVGPVPRSARRWARSAHVHEVRRARHHQHHQHHNHHHHHHDDRDGTDVSVTDENEDVFGTVPVCSGGMSQSRSAPVTGSFGRDADGAVVGQMAMLMLRGEQERGEDAGGSSTGAGDTWVDTDTDTGADDDGGDGGLWQVDD